MLNVSENSLSDLSLYNFKVDKSPLFAPHPVFNTPIPVPSTMSQAVIKEDGTVLGVVGPRTNIYNYKDTCEVVNESLGNNPDIDLSDIKVTNRLYNDGAYMKRTIEFKKMKIEPQIGDIINFSIDHFDSYNSKWATQIMGMPRRLWCLNGCTSPDYTIKWYSRHSANEPVSLKHFAKTLEDAVIDFQKQEGRFKRMIKTPVSTYQVQSFIRGFCFSPTKNNPRNYSKPLYQELLGSWNTEKSLGDDSLYTLYNTLTRWATHVSTNGQTHTVERHRNSRVALALKSTAWKQLEAA